MSSLGTTVAGAQTPQPTNFSDLYLSTLASQLQATNERLQELTTKVEGLQNTVEAHASRLDDHIKTLSSKPEIDEQQEPQATHQRLQLLTIKVEGLQKSIETHASRLDDHIKSLSPKPEIDKQQGPVALPPDSGLVYFEYDSKLSALSKARFLGMVSRCTYICVLLLLTDDTFGSAIFSL